MFTKLIQVSFRMKFSFKNTERGHAVYVVYIGERVAAVISDYPEMTTSKMCVTICHVQFIIFVDTGSSHLLNSVQ